MESPCVEAAVSSISFLNTFSNGNILGQRAQGTGDHFQINWHLQTIPHKD